MQNLFNIARGRYFTGLAIFSLLSIVALGIVFTVRAAGTDNLSGYAWSSTIGWVSMNCTTGGGCGSTNYGVKVDASGLMSGYAWSSNAGWVSFNSGDLTGCPTAPCEARFTKATGFASGWARALAGAGTVSQRGGWGGWIHLAGTGHQVKAVGCAWEGVAWGGGSEQDTATVGWLSFKGSSYGVTGAGVACADTSLPVVLSMTINPSVVSRPASTGSVPVTYTFSLNDTVNQTIGVQLISTPSGAVTPTNIITANPSAYWSGNSLIYPWTVQNPRDTLGVYTYRMTAPDGRTSQAIITVVASNTLPECRDGIDNDVPVDGKIDFGGGANNDPGCTSLDDPSEATPTQCSDGYDNDGDFKTDFPVPPGDRGCTSAADNDEYNPPECSDGINNDGDAGTDYGVGAHVPPYDLQCSSLADDSEASANAQLTLYPTAFTVRPRQTTVLNWSVVDVQANSCTLSGTNGDSWVLTGSSGTKTTAAITQATVYTLSCTDLGVQPVSQSTTVKILPTFNEF